jgi:Holliday junction DNA helicase RuvA
MIGRLTGRVVEGEADTVLLDVHGVGYEVIIPLGTLGRATTNADGETTLFVHTHAREDALLLYGFSSEYDRRTFRVLIGVSNVGPKTALALLSALPAEALARALAAKDVAGLTRIPGVGKKTAERLVLELKDKLLPVIGASAAPKRGQAAPDSNLELVIGALVRMGFKQSEAERAVGAMGEQAKSATLADAVKEALVLLAK